MCGDSGYGARNPDELTEEEIDELVDTWEPEPLIPPGSVVHAPFEVPVITRHAPDGKHVYIEGDSSPKLNLASNNFLGYASNPSVKAAAKETLEVYSCGSCGPRGFYGTTEKHVQLEVALAKFMNSAEAICYSGEWGAWRVGRGNTRPVGSI